MTWKTIPDFPNYEMCSETKEIRNKNTKKIMVHKGSNIGLRKDGTQYHLNIELLYEKVFIPPTSWKHRAAIDALKIEYPEFSDKFETAFSLPPNERDKLMIVLYSEFISEWATENTENIGQVAGESNKKYLWNCLEADDHPQYSMKMNHRTAQGVGCPACRSVKARAKTCECLDLAAQTENEVMQLFVEENIKYENTGSQSGHLFDGIATHKDGIPRGIQIKAITDPKGNNKVCCLSARSRNKYPAHTLLVGINSKHNIYFAAFTEEVDNVRIISFPTRENLNSKYHKFMFRDRLEWKKKVIELSKEAIDVRTVEILRGYEMQCEHNMKEKLRELGHIVHEPPTVYGDIDAFIGNEKYPVQLKYSACQSESGAFRVPLGSSHKKKLIPYDVSAGFNAIVIQSSVAPNDFLILPKFFLKRYVFLKDESIGWKGKQFILVYPPENKDDPLSKYWNRFDLLDPNNKCAIERDIFDDFEDYCKTNNLLITIIRKLRMIPEIKINGKDTITLFIANNGTRLYLGKSVPKGRPYCLEDNIFRFIFIDRDNSFYVIPPSILVHHGYVGREKGEGKYFITLKGNNVEPWLLQFKNDFSWLNKDWGKSEES